VVPAAAGAGASERGIGIVSRTSRGVARTALKLSSAFGGANAALVVGLDEPPASITGIKETVLRNFGLFPAAPGGKDAP